jgi:hypothetical protein
MMRRANPDDDTLLTLLLLAGVAGVFLVFRSMTQTTPSATMPMQTVQTYKGGPVLTSPSAGSMTIQQAPSASNAFIAAPANSAGATNLPADASGTVDTPMSFTGPSPVVVAPDIWTGGGRHYQVGSGPALEL